MKKTIITAFTMLVSSFTFVNAENRPARYVSEEFRSDDSRIPGMFLCGFLAEHYKFSPGAMEIIIDLLVDNGVTPEKFDMWGLDAVYFNASVMDGRKPVDVWREWNCDVAISNMRQM